MGTNKNSLNLVNFARPRLSGFFARSDISYMGTFPTMALFFTISLCSPVVEGRAYCGSPFVRLFICLLVADVGGGIFHTPSHKEKEKKDALLPTYPKETNVCIRYRNVSLIIVQQKSSWTFFMEAFSSCSHFKSVISNQYIKSVQCD